MKRRDAVLLGLGAIVFVLGSSLAVFFGHRTFSTNGERAVATMNAEELTALRQLLVIDRRMSTEDVYLALGPPSDDLYVYAKWNGFGGSALSQARVYFIGGHPTKVRWMKLGYFVYERNL